MTYEEAIQSIPCGRYRHFKGNEYEVIDITCVLDYAINKAGHCCPAFSFIMRKSDCQGRQPFFQFYKPLILPDGIISVLIKIRQEVPGCIVRSSGNAG